jgi:hypothetical protein
VCASGIGPSNDVELVDGDTRCSNSALLLPLFSSYLICHPFSGKPIQPSTSLSHSLLVCYDQCALMVQLVEAKQESTSPDSIDGSFPLPSQEPLMHRRSFFIVVVVLLIIALASAGAYFGLPLLQSSGIISNRDTSLMSPTATVVSTTVAMSVTTLAPTVQPSPKATLAPSPTTPPATPTAAVLLSPLLADVKFPTQKVDYPVEWPQELRYPDQFTLVQTSSGMESGGIKGWAAKLRYTGSLKDAADLLSSFFTSNGWQIAERNELSTGGLSLLIERNNRQNTGLIVLESDPADSNSIRIVATVFP